VHATYFVVICVLPGCTIFFHVVTNSTIFPKKLLNIKCVLIFSTTFVWNISHSKCISATYHKCTYVEVKVKANFTSEQAIKAQKGNRSIGLLVL
jgi:hypothetical protein